VKKHKAHDDRHIDETWLIPYADLLTLLLALFIVLFASSQIDQKKFEQLSRSLNAAFQGGSGLFNPSTIVPVYESGDPLPARNSSKDAPSEEDVEMLERIRQETENFQNLKNRIDVFIADNGLTSELETNLDSEYLKIRISDKALFDSGSAEIRQEARDIAMELSRILETAAGYEIIIAGHTDNVPINTREFPSNWDLSAKRALNFMKILLQNQALDPAKFSTIGYGEYKPIASNDTVEGRALNRRVEVLIMRKYPDAGTPQNVTDSD
jgi:Flagellar motor protein